MTPLLRSLWAKLAISFAVALIVGAIGWFVPMTPPTVFDVSARIWIQSKIPDAGDSRSSSSLFQSFMTYFNSPILTACEVLKSTRILEEATEELKKKLPQGKVPAAADLRDSVRVDPVANTDILAITYRDTDPAVGTAVVQAILDAFMRLETNQTSYSATKSKAFLQTQLDDEQKELKKIESDIRAYQIANNLVDVGSQIQDILKRQSNTEDALREAEARRQEASQKIAYLQAHLGVNADDALAVGDMEKDPILSQAKKRLAELEAEYSELGTNYRPEHPQMRQLQALISQLKETSRQRLTTILNDAGINEASARGGALSRVNQDLVKEVVAAKAEEMTQEHVITRLRTNLAKMDLQVSKLPEKQLALADLLRAQKVSFERISVLEGNLSSAKLIEAVNKGTPNFQVIDRPQIVNVTVVSKKPKFLTALVFGLVFGAGTFFLLDWLDPRLRRISAIMNTLPLPVVGWLNHLPVDLSRDSLESIHRLRLGLKTWLTNERKQFVVTSADYGDGKTIISAGLALSFAQSGLKVVLIDADLVTPSVHQTFKNLPASPGLSDYLAAPGEELLSKIGYSINKNLTVIPAGAQNKSDNMLLSSDKLARFVRHVQTEADIVIFDTPAASESSASLALLSPEVNLLVVVRLNHTHQPDLRLLATQLKQHEYGSSGIILANVKDDAVASALARSEAQEEMEPA